jgi:hypothetical protein
MVTSRDEAPSGAKPHPFRAEIERVNMSVPLIWGVRVMRASPDVAGSDSRIRSSGPSTIEESLRCVVRLLGMRRIEPERRRALEYAGDLLHQLCDLKPCCSNHDQQPRHEVDARLGTLLKASGWLCDKWRFRGPTLEQAWLFANSLRALWIDLAPESALRAYERDHRLPQTASEPHELGCEELRLNLSYNHEVRRKGKVHERARRALKSRYMMLMGLTLWVLVAASFAVAFYAASDERVGLSIAALAGTVGGVLSGARALRSVVNLTGARGFQVWWWV